MWSRPFLRVCQSSLLRVVYPAAHTTSRDAGVKANLGQTPQGWETIPNILCLFEFPVPEPREIDEIPTNSHGPHSLVVTQ